MKKEIERLAQVRKEKNALVKEEKEIIKTLKKKLGLANKEIDSTFEKITRKGLIVDSQSRTNWDKEYLLKTLSTKQLELARKVSTFLVFRT